MDTEKLVSLAPSDILVDDNVRYGLKPYRIERLAEKILSDGGVNTPIEVSPLNPPVDGKRYRLTTGAYRTAAVDKLNTEQKAGLALPARVVETEDTATRLLRQVSENNERENMSPMDSAIAIRKMIDAGLSKMDIRKAFARPGGRKGLKIQPASNAFVNMTLSFLDLPKDIQRKIHDGVVGVLAAYELTKVDADKRQSILEKAEAERIKAIDSEEKEEEKYLATEKKAAEEAAAKEAAEKELADAKKLAEESAAVATTKADELGQAFKAKIAVKGKDEKKKADEHYKSVEAELKSAEQTAQKTAAALKKLEEKSKTLADKALAAKAKLEQARKDKNASGTKTKAVTARDVQKAAAAENASTKTVKLNASEMRDAVKTLTINSKPATKYQKTMQIGALLEQCFDGKITDGQLHIGIARIVGEEKMPTPTPAAKK